MNKTFGVILVVLGLFGLAWGGFTYTTREKVIDIGPIHTRRSVASHLWRSGAHWRRCAARGRQKGIISAQPVPGWKVRSFTGTFAVADQFADGLPR